jgi:RNA polymerase sigma-70 factor (ECF subfamily)
MKTPHREEERESDLIRDCSRGDRNAFDVLWERYWRRIFNFICLRVGNREEAQDLTQEVFIRAWFAISRGREVLAFQPWVYKIARNVVYDWIREHRRGGPTVAIEELGDIAAPQHSVEASVELKLSCEFLFKRLEEVLAPASDSIQERTGASVRKLAFMYFHADGMTLPEIQAELAPLCRSCGMPQVTLPQLNNWLCRGDILSSLVRHLVRNYPCWITTFTGACVEEMSLDGKDAEVARLRWRDGVAIEAIADRCGTSVGEVANATERISRQLVPLAVARMKAALHDARKDS